MLFTKQLRQRLESQFPNPSLGKMNDKAPSCLIQQIQKCDWPTGRLEELAERLDAKKWTSKELDFGEEKVRGTEDGNGNYHLY